MTLMSQIRTPSCKAALIAAVTIGPLVLAAALLSHVLAQPAPGAGLPAFQLHGPDLELLASTPPVILVHLAFGLLALMVGAILMVGRKGARMHRILGWGWVLAVGIVALSVTTLEPIRANFAFGQINVVLMALVIADCVPRRTP